MNKMKKVVVLSVLLHGMMTSVTQTRCVEDHVVDAILVASVGVGAYYTYKWLYPTKKNEVISEDQDEAARHEALLKRSTERREQQNELVEIAEHKRLLAQELNEEPIEDFKKRSRPKFEEYSPTNLEQSLRDKDCSYDQTSLNEKKYQEIYQRNQREKSQRRFNFEHASGAEGF